MINTPLVAYVRYMRIEIVDRHARGLEKKTVVSHEEILSRSSSCFLPLVSSTTRNKKILHLFELKFLNKMFSINVVSLIR